MRATSGEEDVDGDTCKSSSSEVVKTAAERTAELEFRPNRRVDGERATSAMGESSGGFAGGTGKHQYLLLVGF